MSLPNNFLKKFIKESIPEGLAHIYAFVVLFLAITSGVPFPRKYFTLSLVTVVFAIHFISKKGCLILDKAQIRILKLITLLSIFLMGWNYFVVPTLHLPSSMNLKWLLLIHLPEVISLLFIIGPHYSSKKELYNTITYTFIVSTAYMLIVRDTHSFNNILSFSIPESTAAFSSSIFFLYAYWKKDFKRCFLFALITILFYKRAAIMTMVLVPALDITLQVLKRRNHYYAIASSAIFTIWYLIFQAFINYTSKPEISAFFSGRPKRFLNVFRYWDSINSSSLFFGNGFGSVSIASYANLGSFPNPNSMIIDFLYSIGLVGTGLLLVAAPTYLLLTKSYNQSKFGRLAGLLLVHLSLISVTEDPHIFLFDTLCYLLVLFLASDNPPSLQKCVFSFKSIIDTVFSKFKEVSIALFVLLSFCLLKYVIPSYVHTNDFVFKSSSKSSLWVSFYQTNLNKVKPNGRGGMKYFDSMNIFSLHLKNVLDLPENINFLAETPIPGHLNLTLPIQNHEPEEISSRFAEIRESLFRYLRVYERVVSVISKASFKESSLVAEKEPINSFLMAYPELNHEYTSSIFLSNKEIFRLRTTLKDYAEARKKALIIIKRFIKSEIITFEEESLLIELTQSILSTTDFKQVPITSSEKEKLAGHIPFEPFEKNTLHRLFVVPILLLGFIVLLTLRRQEKKIFQEPLQQ